MKYTFAQVRKAAINASSLAASLVTLGVFHGSTLVVVNSAIAIVAVVLHFKVPNAR